jgi:hypothetical protein
MPENNTPTPPPGANSSTVLFPSANPIWGFNPYDRLPDVVERSYENSEQSNAFNVVPDDNNLLATPITQLYIGQGGDVKVQLQNGAVVTFHNLAEGVTYPWTFQIVQIFATGTTASQIVGIQ